MWSEIFFRNFQSDLLSLESKRLKAEIDQTRTSMESARNHFDQATDPSLIDCYIYELNAAQLRYQFLLRRFKFLEES
ncbi:YaaL family protein [Brotaphodocola sp.]|uniref:YaaL family protein n=1 Tax=Brotaphodocola sp. TaxID=3073577 RepID=UPI003D7DB5E9